MIIPYHELSKAALTAVLEDIASRDGTDYGAVELSLASKVSHLQKALAHNKAVLWFDSESETCSVIDAADAQKYL